MSFAPRCPRCGGEQEIIFLGPGDKAARCRYCNLVVDLPDGESRTETDEEEVRPDGTRVARHVVVSRSDGVAPEQQESMMKQIRGQLEGAAATSPEHANRIFQALGRLQSGDATVKVISTSTTRSGGGADLSSLPADLQAQVAAALGGTPRPSTVTVEWSDGQRYPGKLVEEESDQCLVEFSDGSRRWVPAGAVHR